MYIDTGLVRGNKGKQLTFELEDECIVCTSHDPNKDGYIRLYAGKGVLPRMQMMHRIVWKRSGKGIPEGYEIDHKCRNRRCCNVDHLQLLTVSEHKIKTNKERYADRIEEIQYALKCGFKNTDIAAMFEVSPATVFRIKRKGNRDV